MGSLGFSESPYKNVMHELLLALLGKPGEVFVEAARSSSGTSGCEEGLGALRSPTCGTFQLSQEINWIEEPDRVALEEVASLGYHFGELDTWVKQERCPAHKGSSKYLKAMACGLSEVLEWYASAVLRLEQFILREGCPAISLLQRFATEFRVLLGPLHFHVHKIRASNIKGKQLLSELQKKAKCGVPELSACFERMLWHTHQVLFKQLTAWMVHGLVQDPHGEFFIQQVDREDDPEAFSHLHTGNPQTQSENRADPDTTLIEEWHSGFRVLILVPKQLAEH